MVSPLPDFESPPVVEVAISLQFKPLDLLRSSHFGLLWQAFRTEGFTRTEDHGEIGAKFEDFEGQPMPRVGIRVQSFDDAPPLPRVWYLDDKQNELIQIQRDRIVVNWRQGSSPEPYPRYVSLINRFRFALRTFSAFAASENLGNVSPTQCEVTYVNHIPAGEGWLKHGELGNVVTTWNNKYSDSFLSVPEDVEFRARYRMNDAEGRPLGRLYIAFQPGYRTTEGKPIFVMNVIARGEPQSADSNAVFRLFDYEHDWIVRSFASITTSQMHEVWRRKNGR
jgi:uncharacterized protein (TIGR04255 family)